ncbi:substrate adhesion molecule [Tieghemostelium lacteum]|uniref:Substrate adhesion molecule n=1 Tax=Tieghemostelium lacteum TaxID=361077 RepID=A0A151Z9Q9_TIELA|nr:substrate adhesion molecule [Tieghemostelium lacteum]|eukprot:KYQ90676.1 substrate adhesion molecule [Tieghemostelium lacteum]
MIMKNHLVAVVLLLVIVTLVSGQGNRFSNGKQYSYPVQNSFSDFFINSTMAYGVTDREAVKFSLTQLDTLSSGSQIVGDYFLLVSGGTTLTIDSMAILDGTTYAMTSSYFLKLKDPSRTQIDNTENWTGIGGYQFNNYIFSIITPDDSVVTYDTTQPFIEANWIADPIQTTSAYSYVLDTAHSHNLAFIGDEYGNIQVYDSSSRSKLAFYSPSNPSGSTEYLRYAGVVDSANSKLYYCTDNNANGITIDVFDYTNILINSTLVSVGSFDINLQGSSGCSAAAIDPIQGQLFFAVFANSLFLIGTDLQGNNQDFTEIAQESDAVLINVEPTDSTVQVYAGSQLYTFKYKSICPNDCSGNGQCLSGTCSCTQGYSGNDCSIKQCLNNCTGPEFGTCNDGTCLCTPNWSSTDCSVRRCPDDCFQRGTCSGAPLYECTCNDGFNGTSCGNAIVYPPPPCANFTSSSSCVERVGCGWCHMDSECKDGDRYGPYEGFCRTWYFDQDVETGVIILASIFIGLIGILFLIDIFSTIPLDKDRANAYSEEYSTGSYPKLSHEDASILWWRDQRSAKAWTLMDQFQFLSLISHLGVVFPSRFLHFTEYLDWTNLGIPFPSTISPPEVQSVSRDILSMYQYDNSLGVGPMYQLANILFWWGLLLGAFLVPLLLCFFILSLIEKAIHYKEVARNRIIHITLRILTFGYIGVLMSSCYSMIAPIHNYKVIIPGAILFVLYGIGYPLGLFFILRVPESRLHNPTFKQQFGQLYVNFKPKTDHRFFIFAFIKRFMMAVIIGILAFDPAPEYPITGTDLAVPIVQVAVIVIALAGYCVLLIIRKPYFDHFHLWLEYFLTGVNIVTVALCLTHIKSPSVAGELIAWILQALALVACIAAYFISWIQMKSAVFVKLRKIFSCCSSKKEKEKSVDMNTFKQ